MKISLLLVLVAVLYSCAEVKKAEQALNSFEQLSLYNLNTDGTDLVYLKQQLGHKHLKTTAQYIHLITEHSWRIKHPLADMEIRYITRT